jgi:putative DNA methylase
MTTPRLIETWLPIAALGEESVRERRSMTALPPTYYLHVWWARRPLVASRAAVLASLLPADTDHERFLHAIGIHGDPVSTKRSIVTAKRTGADLGADPYGYRRAFTYTSSDVERGWIVAEMARIGLVAPSVLDPTAGGGSVPFEAVRLGLGTIANDLNPVAAFILRLTVDAPLRFGEEIVTAFRALGEEFVRRAAPRLAGLFPKEPEGTVVDGYLWARTVRCPYCRGVIPLSPNWRLASDGTGVKLRADPSTRVCTFTIVTSVREQSSGTVKDGDAQCPYPDCGRIVDGDEIKAQAQAGLMGDQLYAIAYKIRVPKRTTGGRGRASSERRFRAAGPGDDVSSTIAQAFLEKLPEWEALGCVPTEPIGDPSNYERGHRLYGMTRWRDLFSPRQLFGHAIGVEVIRELVEERRAAGALDDLTKAAVGYLASALDKLLNYNTRSGRWDTTTGRVRSMFDRHGYAFVWSYAEMAPAITGLGYEWAFEQTSKCIGELVHLLHGDAGRGDKNRRPAQTGLFAPQSRSGASVTVTNHSADALVGVGNASIDAVVMDPPYYDNVMYGELSDFFYVWLKRTAGLVYPDLFRRSATDKENEAIANPAKFKGQERPDELATRDYQLRMAAIFGECRRVLKPEGILTVMFTHKAAGAWDALATGLLEAGFTITASWPINTEAESSLHIKDKAAANSTIFLVCRPRPDRLASDTRYWEDAEPLVAEAVRRRIESFEKAGMRGVDLYLSCFGPALEEFAKHWPLTRGQPRPITAKRGKRKGEGDAVDPYAVTPEDALDAARREVKNWKLDRLLRTSRHADLDAITEWFVLAWDAFQAPEFPYDEALRLARVVGVDLDGEILGRVGEKKGGDVLLWDSAKRAAKSALGPPDGSRSMLDALHHAAHRGRTVGLDAARELLSTTKADQQPSFIASLTVLLEVLPVSSRFTNLAEEAGPVADAASDFDVLEQLRRLAYSDRIREPEQLKLLTEAKS